MKKRSPSLVDFHTHSRFSPDAAGDITEMCQTAFSKGLSALAVTDHCEMNAPDWGEGYQKSIRESHHAATQAARAYDGRLKIAVGMELGQPLQNLPLTEELLRTHRFDFIIGSLHNCAGKPDFYYIDFSAPETDTANLLHTYYKELLEMVQWGKFDVLGHLTYPLRYANGVYSLGICLDPYLDYIDEIFKTLIAKGKGIEVNTSGLRQRLKETMPGQALIRRYRELGGEILTVGSDSHCPDLVGEGIAEALEQIKTAGFDYITTFWGRKPHFIRIE